MTPSVLLRDLHAGRICTNKTKLASDIRLGKSLARHTSRLVFSLSSSISEGKEFLSAEYPQSFTVGTCAMTKLSEVDLKLLAALAKVTNSGIFSA